MVSPQSQNVHKLPQNWVSQSSSIRWQMAYFLCFVVRMFWRNWLAINSLLVSVSRRNSWFETFRFHVNCIHFCGAFFVRVRPAQLCTQNSVSFYMCSAVEVAWLAQNIRHSSTRVWLHLQWRLGMYLVNNSDSSYLTILTSQLHVGFDGVNDSNLTFKTTKNHHAKSTFMLAPQFPPHFLNSRFATAQEPCQ